MPRGRGWRGPTRTVAASDLEDRALGAGDPRSPDKSVGKRRGRYASVDLTGGGVGPVKEYDVGHDLGDTPTMVSLVDYENSGAAVTITARGIRRENWSHSHVHVEVTVIAGTLDGTVARFLVEGR